MKQCEFCGANLDANEACNCRIRVLFKEVGKPPEEMVIDNTLEALQGLVQGNIEVVHFGDLLMIVNEDGKFLEIEPHIAFPADVVVGNVVVLGEDGEDFRGLTQTEIIRAKKMLEEQEC